MRIYTDQNKSLVSEKNGTAQCPIKVMGYRKLKYHTSWLGWRRKLARVPNGLLDMPIKRKTEGNYYLLNIYCAFMLLPVLLPTLSI